MKPTAELPSKHDPLKEYVVSVVPFFGQSAGSTDTKPFACIFSHLEGEPHCEKARIAIAVSKNSANQYEYSNAVYTTKTDLSDTCPPFKWPALAKALQNPPKGWSVLLNPRDGDAPYAAVKYLAEGDREMELGEPTFGPAEALMCLTSWSTWQKNGCSNKKRQEIVFGNSGAASVVTAKTYTSQINSYEKYVGEMGLNQRVTYDCESEFAQLKNKLWQVSQIAKYLQEIMPTICCPACGAKFTCRD